MLPPKIDEMSAMSLHNKIRSSLLTAGWLAVFMFFEISPAGRCEAIHKAQRQFILNHCSDCHDEESHKGGLNLVDLDYQPANAANFAIWIQVHDRVRAGEMPPKKRDRPDPTDSAQFVNELGRALTEYEQAVIARNGRAMKRRLNRYEYENTLRDLLDVPWIQIKEQLPEDGEKYRYNKIGEALDVSHARLPDT